MFPQRLKEEREKRGYSMERLADMYNLKFDGRLNKSTISRYENGKQEPMISVVMNFASLFGVSMDYMSGKTAESTKITSFNQKPHIEKYNNLNDDNQKTVNNLIDDLSEKQKTQKARDDKFEAALQELEEKTQRQALLIAYGGKKKIHEFTEEELANLDKLLEEYKSPNSPKWFLSNVVETLK